VSEIHRHHRAYSPFFLTQQNTHKFHQYNQYIRLKKHSVNRCVTIRSEDRDKFNEAPKLQADLGYYSVLLLAKAFEAGEPIKRLRDGITIDGKQFQFDAAGVLHSARQETRRLHP